MDRKLLSILLVSVLAALGAQAIVLLGLTDRVLELEGGGSPDPDPRPTGLYRVYSVSVGSSEILAVQNRVDMVLVSMAQAQNEHMRATGSYASETDTLFDEIGRPSTVDVTRMIVEPMAFCIEAAGPAPDTERRFLSLNSQPDDGRCDPMKPLAEQTFVR